ncbi:MAG: DNA mismatch repair protein MutS [Clostridia bacterium]|jgi:DNA mismatch repair protein MutS|nr:DNA mismatch repair protein MutS [Clostridia bacterium]
MEKLTPMMKQYTEIKNEYKDCILFYRLGDFYEMFFDDALTASRELEITLTARNCGLEEKAPMCGVPFHSAENYINRLVDKGYKVAICEQVEDAAAAKGIVKRDVVRIVTPGTVINQEVLDENKNNFVMSIYKKDDIFGVSVLDITTGNYRVTEILNENKIIDEVAKYTPAELLIAESTNDSTDIVKEIKDRFDIFVNIYKEWNYDFDQSIKLLCEHFNVSSLNGFGLEGYTAGISSANALLNYAKETQKVTLSHISKIYPYNSDNFMMIDVSSRRNLELTETMREKSKKGSLLWVLDKTKTAMGGRLLRDWITQPLINHKEINERLLAVGEFKSDTITREELKEMLNSIYDIERLISKVVYMTANARDLISLKSSLEFLPHIKTVLSEMESKYVKDILERLDTLSDIYKLIDDSIVEDAPFSVREGGIIKTGYNDDIDKYRSAKTEGKNWIAKLENEEKEKTGIKNIKIKYTKVFGYYLEVTKSYFDLVPERYIRKQTLANAERYITPELKEIENDLLGAEEKLVALEYNAFVDIRTKISSEVTRILETANQISKVDVLQSLGEVAYRNNYVMPNVTNKDKLFIDSGRHPVVEKMIDDGMFIVNNTYLDNVDDNISIITGPNMAGKSTYMRQVALIVLMAQIGSFVPAKEAEIGVVDRIFTRVGASDDLASGQSTFMVEMNEVSNILHNATSRSLLILDEIGRGTSTFDGLSIAWSVVEHIAHKVSAKTLFATHYHELTELEGKLDGVKNYMIDVKEDNDDIIFLRKIKRGGASNSYGIQVAKLAGLPNEVIERSKVILSELNRADIVNNAKQIDTSMQLKIAEVDDCKYGEFIDYIKKIDVMNITPIEALSFIQGLKEKANNIN